MPLKFANVDLSPPTEQALTLCNRWWDRNAADLFGQIGYDLDGIHRVPLTASTTREKARLNTLYWPTGASRWGFLHALVGDAQAAAIQTAVGTVSPVSATLSMKNDDGTGIETAMFAMAIRPLFVLDPTLRLWWITLVDPRYYWWMRPLSYSFSSMWPSLLESLTLQASGLTPTVPSISSNYGSADVNLWTFFGKPLPLLIDAAARTVGLRCCYKLNGTVEFRTAAAALTLDDTQYVSNEAHVSFGARHNVRNIIGNIPATVRTAFWGDLPSFPSATKDVTLASLALPEYSGATGVANTYAWIAANMSGAASIASRDNYATEAARDYYKWALSINETVFRKIIAIESTGLEDRIEWEYQPGQREVGTAPARAQEYIADNRLPMERIITRIVPLDQHDRNLYGDSPFGPYPDQSNPTPNLPCVGHGWLVDKQALIDANDEGCVPRKMLGVRFTAGSAGGRCECWDAQPPLEDDPPLPAFYNTITGLWDVMDNVQSCCSCLLMTIDIPGTGVFPPITSELALVAACDLTANLAYDMRYMCATETQAHMALHGPTLCSDEPDCPECDNTARAVITCEECDIPNVDCDQCQETCAPGRIRVNGTGFSGAAAIYNRPWYAKFDDDCEWIAICGSTTVTITKTPTGTNNTTVIQVTFNGPGGTFVYRYSEPEVIVGQGANVVCFTDHTLSRFSGDTGLSPATITISDIYCVKCPMICGSIDFENMAASPSNATGTCGCVAPTLASFVAGVSATFGIAAPPCDNAVQLHVRCSAGRLRLDISGSAFQSFTQVSLTYDGVFVWVVDVCFTGGGFDPCGGCVRLTFTAPLLP